MGKQNLPLALHAKHLFLAGSLHMSFSYFVTLWKNKMKQSPWHLTLMFLHSKTAFYSDISSFHVVVQNAPHSEVQRILPLIQAFFFFLFFTFRIKLSCQETVSINWAPLLYIEGITFITWMGEHSLFLVPLWIDGNEMELTLDPASVLH